MTGNSTEFKDLIWFIAHYTADHGIHGPQPTTLVMPNSFGGRRVADIRQYAGSVSLCGSNVDVNIAERIPWNVLPKEEELAQPVWATWTESEREQAGKPYRSYLLYATTSGLRKYHVKSEAEHRALAASGIAGDEIIEMSCDELRAFTGTPEPDE
jgi:hypothetical protein